MTMTHPGLPPEWVVAVLASLLLLSLRLLVRPGQAPIGAPFVSVMQLPGVRVVVGALTASPWPLLLLKLLMVVLFLTIIAAGLFGTPVPERNLATVLTWNLWWAGLIVAVFFLGSAWCAVCPWDSLSHWLVRRRLWRRTAHATSLGLKVPRGLRNVWPALLLLIGLTWLELGLGVTTDPYLTAVLALLMIVMATASMALFERKAFCRHICPVGRTVGFYSQLAPVALRPVDPAVCADCRTLECYHGSATVEPCPTHLVMGRLTQNTFCTSCGNCSQSCPAHNVAWRLRAPSEEAIQTARPRWDEAWFMLGLLALTGFHGISMLPVFETWMSRLATLIGDSGQLLWSFSLLLAAALAAPIAVYVVTVGVMQRAAGPHSDFRRLFTGFAFVTLPLAFAYHLAHNLNHLVREHGDVGALLANPLGTGTLPLTMMEKHMRHTQMLIPQAVLDLLQAGLLVFGFWIALEVIRQRGGPLLGGAVGCGWRFSPMVIYALAVTGFHLWLLTQPMVMRM